MSKLDYEYIVTKEVLKNNDITLISPLCNVCYLSKFENRSKKDKTIYDHYNHEKITAVNMEQLSRFIYPTKNEIRQIIELEDQLDVEIYRNFLEIRSEMLCNKMLEALEK